MGTVYSTKGLAQEIMGKDDKSATRELRKFLRAKAVAEGGRVGTDTPGKGGRYAIEMTKRDITAMKKAFTAWQAEQAEAAKARAELKVAQTAAKAQEIAEAPEEVEMTESDIELEGPAEGDIDSMLAELAEEVEEVEQA